MAQQTNKPAAQKAAASTPADQQPDAPAAPETEKVKAVNDPKSVAAKVNADQLKDVMARYGMTEEDFARLTEAMQDALIRAHEKQVSDEQQAAANQEQVNMLTERLAKAEKSSVATDAGRFYDPIADEGKTAEDKLKKFAEVIKNLLAGKKHSMFTLVLSQKVEGNHTVVPVVELPPNTRYQNRTDRLTLCAFTAEAVHNNPDDLPAVEEHLQRGTAIGMSA